MEVCDLSIDSSYEFFNKLELTNTEQYIAQDVMKEIKERLEFLKNVGLNYLTLNQIEFNIIRRRITENKISSNTDRL